MKRMSEVIKDFFYDAIDYILIIVIIAVVAGVIGWRLDILFTKNLDEAPAISEETPDDSNQDIGLDDTDPPAQDEDTINDGSNQEENPSPSDNPDNNSEEEDVAKLLEVKVPEGSLAPTIATILFDKGLIEDKTEFLLKAREMELDTKLKSGIFNIEQDTSIESIIKTIARAK